MLHCHSGFLFEVYTTGKCYWVVIFNQSYLITAGKRLWDLLHTAHKQTITVTSNRTGNRTVWYWIKTSIKNVRDLLTILEPNLLFPFLSMNRKL